MPVDTKRIRGPEESQSPLLFLSPGKLPEASSRQGVRGNGDVRPLFLNSTSIAGYVCRSGADDVPPPPPTDSSDENIYRINITLDSR
ncbi:exosome complex component MTR3-like [Carassius gibelio]|uniref:exosome complex component MTR3-like n=1 Tax=Carassius gibelio TaxID=101364 RepID=UPI0022787E31|nr:exosome complex component MTR3-like [Carassius gibelio]